MKSNHSQFSNSNNASFCLVPNDDRDSLLLLILGGTENPLGFDDGDDSGGGDGRGFGARTLLSREKQQWLT